MVYCPFIQCLTIPDYVQIMGEREDNVYKAKLEEQAERYEFDEIIYKTTWTQG